MVWVVERGYQYEGGVPVAAFTAEAAAAEYILRQDPAARATRPDRRRWMSAREGVVWILYQVPLHGGVTP